MYTNVLEGRDDSMSLQPQGATHSIDGQDRREYATQVMFRNIYNSIPKEERARLFGIREMRKVRENWGMDFSREGFRLSDFRRLGSILPPEPAFDSARRALGDEDYVKRTIASARKSYNNLIENNQYPVLLLDPQLQNVPGMDQVATFYATTQGQSMRALDQGQNLSIYRRDGSFIHNAQSAQSTSNPFASSGSENMNLDTQTSESEPEASTESNLDAEAMVGWSTDADNGVDGLDNVLGAYFSEVDQEKLRKHFDGNNIQISREHAQYLENSVEVLKYLRSTGTDFNVEDFYRDGQIDVRLSGSDISVRVFDLDDRSPGQYIGRVYDTYGVMNLQTNDQRIKGTYSPEESTLPLKVMLGHVSGEFQKTASNANSQVRNIDGLDSGKHIFIDRNGEGFRDRYNSVVYRNPAEAERFLNTAIDGADTYFTTQFKFDELDSILDESSSEDIEDIYSQDLAIREKQEAFINDVYMMQDVIDSPFADEILQATESFDGTSIDMDELRSFEGSISSYVYKQIQSEMVGDLESGFNPSFVIDHSPEDTYRQHKRNAVMAALREIDYDTDKLKGNAFATQNVKDNLVTFDPESAQVLQDVDDPFLAQAMQRVQDGLVDSGVIGADKENPPEVLIDDQGIIKWEGHRTVLKSSARAKVPKNAEELADGRRIEKSMISGEIGQIFSPNEHGIIKTNFGSEENYGIVPGYTGYFKFDGEYTDNRMDRFRVKGFEQHLNEKIDTALRSQISRPLKESWDNIPNNFDSTALNGLYHGDVYGRRIDLDFVEKSKLNDETTQAIVTSLSSRVRFGNEYGSYATTNAEARAEWDTQHTDQAAFSYWKAVGEKNMRVLDDDLANIADLSMTGNARTQGVTWYLVDGAEVNADGSITPSSGEMQLDGTIEPDKTAIRKLDYFKYEDYNAWDRVQMSANQIMTAEHVDEGVGTALMNFGGWTYEDSFAVSKEFADRNKVQGEHPTDESMSKLDDLVRHLQRAKDSNAWDRSKKQLLDETGMNWSDDVIREGISYSKQAMSTDEETSENGRKSYDEWLENNGTFRPLKRGDKLSDFGGNKGTIGIIIDRDMDPEEAKRQKLDREVAVFNANPDLDVVGAPYSPLSRYNAGILRELQDGEVQDIVDPNWNNGEGRKLEGAMGRLNFIVTDLTVDEKTKAYTEADVADGRGRLASGQLAWALQSHNATEMLTDIYGHNDGAWSTFREYMIATGLDMEPDGTLRVGYEPHDYTETRQVFNHEDFDTADDFLNEITDKGGFLETPFEMEFLTGNKTNKVPVLSAALRQDTELIDGSMRRSDYNNQYTQMFKHIKDYSSNDELGTLESSADESKRQKDMELSKARAQESFMKIQTEIKERKLDGGHNGKHSFIRDKMMGVRAKHSATSVAVSDPRLSLVETSMDSEIMDALNVKHGDSVLSWRDPIWRGAAVDSQIVVHDESVHGAGVNPASMPKVDGDMDGDTKGLISMGSKEAVEEMKQKLAPHNNMIDRGSPDGSLYLPNDQDFASAKAEAESLGDNRITELWDSINENAKSSDERLRKKAMRDADKYVQLSFREHGYGSDYINLKDRETVKASLNKIVDNGAKGNPSKLNDALDYYDGKAGRKEAKDIQYAKGVQTDDTGLGGAVSQELVSALRNDGIEPALEVSYPVTQAILQIKKDATHAKTTDSFLRKEVPNLYAGKSSDGKRENMTKKQWANDYYDVLTNEDKLGVDVNREFVDAVADVMVGDNGNTVRDIKDVIKESGSPMDQIAYGGGWDSAHDLAKQGNRSLLDGEMTQYFAPISMRDGSVDILAKSDVRDKQTEDEVRRAFEEGFKRSTASNTSKQSKSNKAKPRVVSNTTSGQSVDDAIAQASMAESDVDLQSSSVTEDDGPDL